MLKPSAQINQQADAPATDVAWPTPRIGRSGRAGATSRSNLT